MNKYIAGVISYAFIVLLGIPTLEISSQLLSQLLVSVSREAAAFSDLSLMIRIIIYFGLAFGLQFFYPLFRETKNQNSQNSNRSSTRHFSN